MQLLQSSCYLIDKHVSSLACTPERIMFWPVVTGWERPEYGGGVASERRANVQPAGTLFGTPRCQDRAPRLPWCDDDCTSNLPGVTLCPGRQKRGSAEGCTGATRNRITSVSGNGKGRKKQQHHSIWVLHPIQSTGGLVGVYLSERSTCMSQKEPPHDRSARKKNFLFSNRFKTDPMPCGCSLINQSRKSRCMRHALLE